MERFVTTPAREADLEAPPAGEAPLRVIIADDDPLARRVVRDALQEAGLIVIAEASDGREAFGLARHYRPQLVLMDVVMPGMDGITATRQITAELPDTRVVMLTISDDEDLWLLGIRAGASGFLRKDAIDIGSLPRALRGVTLGEAAISRHLAARLMDHVRRIPDGGLGVRPVKSRLTTREWEVLDLLCAGKTTEEIAEDFVLSEETVRSHIKNVMRKLGVRTRGEAIDAARRLRQGLPDEEE
jgi:DNA-binding NarL/FixJ family response regulator